MELYSRFIEHKYGRMTLYFLGDIHEGHCNHDEEAFRKAVDIIDKDENGYWFGMGDMVDCITISDSKRFNPIEVSTKYSLKDLKDLPYRQIEYVYDKLSLIDHKCIALLIGNHEESYVKYNHSDVYARFHEMFGSNPKKLGYVGYVRLTIGSETGSKHNIDIALNHGVGGGGRLRGFPLNKVHEVFRWTDCDINVMGHIHQLMGDDIDIVRMNQRGNMTIKNRIWGVSGCFLRTYKESNVNYFEARAGGAQTKVGMFVVDIDFDGRNPPKLSWRTIEL